MRFQKNLLGYVFCVMVISCHVAGNPENGHLVTIHDLPKGIKIALFRPIDERLVI